MNVRFSTFENIDTKNVWPFNSYHFHFTPFDLNFVLLFFSFHFCAVENILIYQFAMISYECYLSRVFVCTYIDILVTHALDSSIRACVVTKNKSEKKQIKERKKCCAIVIPTSFTQSIMCLFTIYSFFVHCVLYT